MNSQDSTCFENLYSAAFPSKRTGALFSACSYPTKISPESIAVFIASHTKPGDTVMDVFAGSGTTGLAAHLCARPTPEVLALADRLNVRAVWGPRTAILKDLSVWGSFIARVMCNPPSPESFRRAVDLLLARADEELGPIYNVYDPDGHPGVLRYAIWSDVITCPNCGERTTLWDSALQTNPLALKKRSTCQKCGDEFALEDAPRVLEDHYDPILGVTVQRRQRMLKRIYGRTSGRTWWRDATSMDQQTDEEPSGRAVVTGVPVVPIPWGDLHRSGYHSGMSHLHHFYTARNLYAVSRLWQWAGEADSDVQDALRLLILSYNAVHATLMARVVVKQGQKDLVVTGAQPGVLYVSGLPVEKNVIEGLRRKALVLSQAFELVHGSGSDVTVFCGSSTALELPSKSVDYLFTDPPFGDFIPYAEVNFLNEAWLGTLTSTDEEAIISSAQDKGVQEYGDLLSAVFQECARVLKDDARATVVFHAARAEVWAALQKAYETAGLRVERSGVLDKLQSTFKQSNSMVKVQGDPLLLLAKRNSSSQKGQPTPSIDTVILDLLVRARATTDPKERSPERMYSRFVSRFLEQGRPVPLDASRFYMRLQHLQSNVL